MNIYTDTIRRYAMDARYTGTLAAPDGIGEVGLGAGEAGKRLAVRFALRVRDGQAETVRFQVYGCGFTIAACAAAAELAEGRPLETMEAVDPAAVEAALGGLPPERGYCAGLAVKALRAAVTSALSETHSLRTAVHDLSGEEHEPRVSAADPIYRRLTGSPAPPGTTEEDRHLFACLLTVASQEPCEPATALGLEPIDIAGILQTFFPTADPCLLANDQIYSQGASPEVNRDVLRFLLSHVPRNPHGVPVPTSLWLACILAARAAQPGHLWIAMGFFERPQLTAAIRRHLPSLASANNQEMRWKRFFFKQVCDLSGGTLCKAPNCGECSDYAVCFAPV